MDAWTAAMRAGRYSEAWEMTRLSLADGNPARLDDPTLPYHLRRVWDGSDPSGRHVLVRCYHGLGDTIQFARFLPALAQRARSLTLEVQPRLAPLLSRLAGIDRIVLFDPAKPLAPAECTLEITELDAALRIAPPSIAVPYLAPPEKVKPSGFIGLCYSAGAWDPARSVPPELFVPVCRRFPCATLVPSPTCLEVLNREGCPFDISATAALVSSADLVITVDTMIAHLAGAMGRPTWLLLKAEPDWRWTPDQQGSAWYPSMRLYVQPQPGDWPSVLRTVERELLAIPSLCAGS